METLKVAVQDQKIDPVVEAVTYPGYTRANKRTMRMAINDVLDVSAHKGRFAFIDVPNDDKLYHLRFCLVKILKVLGDRIEFSWLVYSGYPNVTEAKYRGPWHPQIALGKGQKVVKGWCPLTAIVLTFAALNKDKTVPNNCRTAPLKLLTRALGGDFGPLPTDVMPNEHSMDVESGPLPPVIPPDEQRIDVEPEIRRSKRTKYRRK